MTHEPFIFGHADEHALQQLLRCAEQGERAVLCADHHVGYSQPIGGVVAYRNYISPSGVGVDISCGNKAARTSLKANDVDIARVMDEIKTRISFGPGRKNNEPVDHPVLDKINRADVAEQRSLSKMATEQLGTVGGGNHYVDLLEDEQGDLWVGVHFGSRGFGFKTTSGFLALAKGLSFTDRVSEGGYDAPPVLLDVNTPLGQDYIVAMQLAGEYAYAGRDIVVEKVLEILGAKSTYAVHANHNFAWREQHFGESYWVVRKGATPAFPGQQGFVGGSMGDISVVLEGVDSETSRQALYSTIHGAGRVMSRKEAAGNIYRRKKGQPRIAGKVDWDAVNRDLKARGIVIRGGEADEAPDVYRPLAGVIEKHRGTIKVLYTLKPRGVAMAGRGDFDPYRD